MERSIWTSRMLCYRGYIALLQRLKVDVFNLYAATWRPHSAPFAPNAGISKSEVASTEQDEGHLQLHQNLLILSNHLQKGSAECGSADIWKRLLLGVKAPSLKRHCFFDLWLSRREAEMENVPAGKAGKVAGWHEEQAGWVASISDFSENHRVSARTLLPGRSSKLISQKNVAGFSRI